MSSPEAHEHRFQTSPKVSPYCQPQRVEELWFHDGTLVLATETLLFRIYGGLLAKESPIFDDMLRLPKPKDAATVDGCPMVHLFDHGRDVEYFLKALIDYKFFLAFPSPTTFDIVTGIIRLSKKYEVDSLYKRALVHFASAFPMTVADYPICPSWDPTDEYIRALTFARELELDWALPTALYRVCAYTAIEDILNGIRVDNRWLELDPQDKLVCLQQSVELRGSASASILDFLWDPEKIEGCRNYNSTCKDERLRLRKLAEDWRTKNLPLVLWTDEEWSLCNACSTCLNVMKATHQASLEKFWDSLPQRFGLGTWDDLRERKSIALGS